MNIMERLLGPIKKGGQNDPPNYPRPTEEPMGQIPTTLVRKQCWSCGSVLIRDDQRWKGLCDDCKQARDKAMDDKIIPDDRGTF